MKITLYTGLHFIVAVVSSFLLFGVALGFGFNPEKLGFFELSFAFGVTALTGILTFPVWCFTIFELPTWLSYLVIPLQLIVSFVQVNIFLYLWELYASKKQST